MDDTNQPPAEQPSVEPPAEQPLATPPPGLETPMAPPSAMGSSPAPIPPPPGIGGSESDGTPWGIPPPPAGPELAGSGKRTGILIAVGAVAAVVVVLIVIGALAGKGTKLHLPATLGGQPQLTSEVAKGLAQGMRNEIKKGGGEAPIIALYGPATTPQ